MIPPCFYVFKKCTPQDVVYRLDYKNNTEDSGYFQIFRDYGWEYAGQCVGWLYFRKPKSEMDSEQDGEIFSDNESKLVLINHVIKTRLLPIMLIFLCCVIPNLFKCIIRGSGDLGEAALAVFFSVMTLIYLYMIIHCGLKLKKMRKKYSNN